MVRILLIGVTLVLAFIGQGLLRTNPNTPFAGWAILGVATVAFIGMPAWLRRIEEAGPDSRLARLQARAATTPPAVWLLAGSVMCGAVAFRLDSIPAMLPWGALLAWGAGIGLFLAGAWALRAERAALNLAALHAARWELPALLALTLVALLLRAGDIATIPRNFGGDEGSMGLMARTVMRGEHRDPFAIGWAAHPSLWYFAQALALRTFGDDVAGLRLLSALAGVATVPAIYIFGRMLYSRAIGLCAAVLLAAYHYHIHFSRLALSTIGGPLLLLIALAAFFHGYRTRSPFGFALAGVVLGLMQHFSAMARFAWLVVIVVLLHQLLLDRRQLAGVRRHLALLPLGFLLGFGPLLGHFIHNPGDFTDRLAAADIFRSGWFEQQQAQGMSIAQILVQQAQLGFGGFVSLPDRSAWYDPGIPLLTGVPAGLFLFGLGLALFRSRHAEMFVLPAWLLYVGIFGGMMLINAPESRYYMLAAAPICMLIALALDHIRATLVQAVPPAQRYSYALTAVAVLLLALWNINFYFREYTPRTRYGWLNTEASTEIGRYLRAQPDPVYVYFFGAPRLYLDNPTLNFIDGRIAGADIQEPIASAAELPAAPAGTRPLFIFTPERTAELPYIQERYPGGTLHEVGALSEPTLLFVSYEP